MSKHTGKLTVKFYWIIPILLGVSRTEIIGDRTGKTDAFVYSLHITPLFQVGFNWK
jgi:hypothetical protein